MDYSLPGSSVHGILQARILKWAASPFSRGSSQPRDWTSVSCVLHWQAGSSPLAPPGKPTMNSSYYHLLYDGYKYCPPPLENNFLHLHPRIEVVSDKWYPENGSASIPQATPVADTYGPGLSLFKGKWSYSFHYPHCQVVIGNDPCGTKEIAFTGGSGPQTCFSTSPAKVLSPLKHILGVTGPFQP